MEDEEFQCRRQSLSRVRDRALGGFVIPIRSEERLLATLGGKSLASNCLVSARSSSCCRPTDLHHYQCQCRKKL